MVTKTGGQEDKGQGSIEPERTKQEAFFLNFSQ